MAVIQSEEEPLTLWLSSLSLSARKPVPEGTVKVGLASGTFEAGAGESTGVGRNTVVPASCEFVANPHWAGKQQTGIMIFTGRGGSFILAAC